MATRRKITIKRQSVLENKVIWTVVIVIALLIGLALYGYLTGAWDQPPTLSNP